MDPVRGRVLGLSVVDGGGGGVNDGDPETDRDWERLRTRLKLESEVSSGIAGENGIASADGEGS
jgi:hypothetical protein